MNMFYGGNGNGSAASILQDCWMSNSRSSSMSTVFGRRCAGMPALIIASIDAFCDPIDLRIFEDLAAACCCCYCI